MQGIKDIFFTSLSGLVLLVVDDRDDGDGVDIDVDGDGDDGDVDDVDDGIWIYFSPGEEGLTCFLRGYLLIFTLRIGELERRDMDTNPI